MDESVYYDAPDQLQNRSRDHLTILYDHIRSNNLNEIKRYINRNDPLMDSVYGCVHRELNDESEYDLIEVICDCNKISIAFYKLCYRLLCYSILNGPDRISKYLFQMLNPSIDGPMMYNRMCDHMTACIQSDRSSLFIEFYDYYDKKTTMEHIDRYMRYSQKCGNRKILEFLYGKKGWEWSTYSSMNYYYNVVFNKDTAKMIGDILESMPIME